MRLSFIAAALASAVALCEGSTKMVIGYFPNWLYANYPVENIPYTKYTHINYAFAVLNNLDNVPSFPDDWAVESYLPQVVKLAHEKQTKVLLSVGGWTGSKRFSPMVSTAEGRKKFIDWNLDFIEKYQTDGVDIDWEYPGKQAAGCNEFADNDADNFLLLLKELRLALDTKYPEQYKEISMAVHVQPFIKSGLPMKDLKAFVPYFDHVNLMTYDINGAWAATTGPNAPFQADGKGIGAPFSFVESIRDWKAAGVPAKKITAGLAFYGRSMTAQQGMTGDNQFQNSVPGAPKGDSDDAFWDDPYCDKDVGGLSGIWKWTNLRKQGLLQDDFVTPGPGWERHWDKISQTPWLFNPTTKAFISYDDPQSLKVKIDHALCEDLAGVMVWDIHQDNGELIDVVNKIHDDVPASCPVLSAPSNGLDEVTTSDEPDSLNEQDSGYLNEDEDYLSEMKDTLTEEDDNDDLMNEDQDYLNEDQGYINENQGYLNEDQSYLDDGVPEVPTSVSTTPTIESTPTHYSDSEWLGEVWDNDEAYYDANNDDDDIFYENAKTTTSSKTETSSTNTKTPTAIGVVIPSTTTATVTVTPTIISSKTDNKPEMPIVDKPISVGPVVVEENPMMTDNKPIVDKKPIIDPSGSIGDGSGRCSTLGEMKCVDTGRSSQWKTCNFGQWVIRDCGSGLVCYDGIDAGGGLYCNFPSNNDLKASTAAEERYANNGDSVNNVVVVNDIIPDVKDAVVIKNVPYGRMSLPGYRIVPLVLEAQDI